MPRHALMALAFTALAGGGALAQDPIAGSTFATEGGGAHVTFSEEDGELVGRFSWIRYQAETGNTAIDENNPDPELRERPLVGVAMLSGFTQARKGWRGGTIYNPEDGKTYRSSLALDDDDTLKVKGCVTVICKTQTWTRVAATD